MRIIYATDIHGAFAGVEFLFELTKADLYIISGDLLYNPFRNYNLMEEFYHVQQQVRSWIHDPGVIAVPLKLKALAKDLPQDKQQVVHRYFELVERAHKSMKQQYRALLATTDLKPRDPVYFLPGNYDLDLSETALEMRQLHKRSFRTPWGRLAGYGGAPVYTPGIPTHLTVNFHEEPQRLGATSDVQQVLASLDPDIAVTHVPPVGILDGSPTRPWGSWGLREFIENSQKMKLLLCGHVHESWGVKKINDCWVVNSGNFGPVTEPEGYRKGNYFAEIEYDPFRGVESVILKRLDHSSVWHIAEYHETSQKRIQQTVIDKKRFDDWKYRPVSTSIPDSAGDNYFSVEELQIYNQIKLFLRRFETAESEHRVGDLREMVSIARQTGTEIAFDILGSLNFGQSIASSDIDAVLYIENDDAKNRYQPTFWTDLVAQVTENRYQVEFTDIIDLWVVRNAIEQEDDECEELQRFIIYRTIGRPINVRLLRRYDTLLYQNEKLRRKIQNKLRQDLRMLVGTYRHAKSFEKYMQRMRDSGAKVPVSIQKKIHKYLHELID